MESRDPVIGVSTDPSLATRVGNTRSSSAREDPFVPLARRVCSAAGGVAPNDIKLHPVIGFSGNCTPA
jgi:hypothetical protein